MWLRALGAVLIAVSGLSVIESAPVSAAVVETTLTVSSDDSVDATSTVDNSNNNGLVPTYGVIGYVWQYSNDATGGDVTFTQTLGTAEAGVSFDQSNLAQCTGGGTISPDGHTLTCTVLAGDLDSGVGFIPITVSVDGTVPNGTQIPSTLTAQTGTNPPVDGGNTLTAVAAAPRTDLQKNLSATIGQTTINGQLGRVLTYTAAVTLPENPKGTEQVVGDFTFTDDVSQVSPNATLISCRSHNSQLIGIPFGEIGVPNAAAATASNSVVDSGTMTCTQPVAGGPIAVAVTGADFSGASFPTTDSLGRPLATQERFVGAYTISVFIPTSDIVAAGGQINTTNQYRGFDPVSITGQSNYGAGFEPGSDPATPPCPFESDNRARANDNCLSFTVVARTVGADKFLADLNRVTPAGGATAIHAGNGVVTPGQEYFGYVVISNPGTTIERGTGYCDKWDPSTQAIVGFDSLREFASGAIIPPSEYTVQYAVLNMPTDAERRTTLCDDAPGKTWYPSIAAAEAVNGPGTVNASRVLYPFGVEPGDFTVAIFRFRALPNPNGTIIGDWASIRISSADAWFGSPYVKETNSPAVLGDRLTLSTAVLRVSKDTSPSGITSIFAGNNITYSLQPTVRDPAATAESPPVPGVTLTDTISSCVEYSSAPIPPVQIIPGDPGPDGIPCTGDAGETGQTLVFDLGAVVANTTLPPVTYTVTTLGTTPDSTNARNTVVISSDDAVPVDLALRTDTYQVLIRNQATFAIAKTTDTPLVEVGDPYRYALRYRNTTPNTLSNVVLIDELPYVGDGRSTAFSGTTVFTGATNVPANAVVECTTDAHGTINTDPAANTNTFSAACPGNTTAIRVTLTNVATGEFGSITLGFDPAGNVEGDHYINTIGGGRAAGIAPLIPASKPARVDVIASTIGDFVFDDTNGDGLQTAGEPAVAGVRVELTGYGFGPNGIDDGGAGDDEAVTAAALADANGIYSFANLHSGSYGVTFIAPAGREFTLLRAGTDPAIDSDGQSGVATPVVLGVNADDLTIDAGLAPPLLGSLSLTKAIIDPADFDDLGDAATFPVTVSCTGPGTAPDVTRDVTIDRDGTPTIIDGLFTGSVCTVTETDTDGGTVTYDPATPVTIGDGTTVQVVVTNTFPDVAMGSLSLTKAIIDPADFDDLGDAATFPVTVSCTGPAGAPDVTRDVTIDRDGTPTIIDGLFTGSVCTVTETDSDGGTVTYDPATPVTIGDGTTVQVAVTNTFPDAPTGSLVVSKTIVDPDDFDQAGDADTFPVTVTCTGPGTAPDFATDVTINRDGTPVTVDGMYVGAACTITETDTDGGTATYSPAEPVTIPAADDPAQITVTITNTYAQDPPLPPSTTTTTNAGTTTTTNAGTTTTAATTPASPDPSPGPGSPSPDSPSPDSPSPDSPSPDSPSPGNPVTGALPRTGTQILLWVTAGLGLLLAGAILLTTRRRHTTT